jgi:hypothetical protein
MQYARSERENALLAPDRSGIQEAKPKTMPELWTRHRTEGKSEVNRLPAEGKDWNDKRRWGKCTAGPTALLEGRSYGHGRSHITSW